MLKRKMRNIWSFFVKSVTLRYKPTTVTGVFIRAITTVISTITNPPRWYTTRIIARKISCVTRGLRTVPFIRSIQTVIFTITAPRFRQTALVSRALEFNRGIASDWLAVLLVRVIPTVVHFVAFVRQRDALLRFAEEFSHATLKALRWTHWKYTHFFIRNIRSSIRNI